jgi:hypothetical protein
MGADLVGTWKLAAWRRIAGGAKVSYPLGDDAIGVLLYTPTGRMSVHIAAANRPPLVTDDPPLGGDTDKRADSYSTFLAYAGSYDVQGDSVVHHIDVSLFPNWSGEVQTRSLRFDGNELVLRTPPIEGPAGNVVNELVWTRES